MTTFQVLLTYLFSRPLFQINGEAGNAKNPHWKKVSANLIEPEFFKNIFLYPHR